MTQTLYHIWDIKISSSASYLMHIFISEKKFIPEVHCEVFYKSQPYPWYNISSSFASGNMVKAAGIALMRASEWEKKHAMQ